MSDEIKRAALTAFRLSLQPVLRVLLRTGVTWRDAAEICKATMVDVATRDFGLHGRLTNISRVAIMTGLSRREVRRLRDVLASEQLGESSQTGGATRVLTGWFLDPEFSDEGGKPRELSFEGEGPTFVALCRKYAGDIAPITMLRELVRVGAARETAAGVVQALKRYYMPLQMDPEALLRGGSMLADMGATVNYNLGRAADSPSRFLGRATNPNLRPADARAFRAFLEREGQVFLEHVDEWLSSREVRELPAGGRHKMLRLGVGLYQIENEISGDGACDGPGPQFRSS